MQLWCNFGATRGSLVQLGAAWWCGSGQGDVIGATVAGVPEPLGPGG